MLQPIRLVSIDDAQPFGRAIADIDQALLQRSHQSWQEAGLPIEPPDPRGHTYVKAGVVLASIAGVLVFAILGWSLLSDPSGLHVNVGGVRFDIGSLFPSGMMPAIPSPSTTVWITLFGLAFAFACGGFWLGLRGRYMLREMPQEMAAPVRSKRNKTKRMWTWAVAAGLLVIGTVLFAQPFMNLDKPTDLTIYLTRDLPPALLGLLMMIGGFYAGDRARQLAAPTASELQANDPRPPVLLLRSFRDEKLKVLRLATQQGPQGRSTRYSMVRLEEAVAEEFGPYGPLVAIGRPGEPIAERGAARNYYSDAEWKGAVTKWMDEARIIVVVPGLTKGLGWELDTIEKRGHIGKLLILMPSQVGGWMEFIRTVPVLGSIWGALGMLRLVPDPARRARETLQKRWSVIRDAFGDTPAFAGLPAEVPDGAMVLCPGTANQPTVVTGPFRAEEEGYEAAVRLAVYAMNVEGRAAA